MTKPREIPGLPPGGRQSMKNRFLETGSNLLQDVTPMRQFDIYVVGFHCARHHPDRQMEAHHYCQQVNEDFFQCAIFDGNTARAHLIGIEYIISEKLFDTLPEEEKGYWHPHNFEVLSGQLVAPGLPQAAETAMMKTLMNSYGKTWHTWHTGRHDGADPGTPLPYGEPMLMWSFNRDGEGDQAMKDDRDQKMGIDTAATREARRSLAKLAHPQRGVDTLKGVFPEADPAPPLGVWDVDADED